MKRFGLMLLTLFCLLPLSNAYAVVDLTVFDGDFVRGTGAPFEDIRVFTAVEGSARIILTNGGLEDGTNEKVSSSVVLVNGQEVFISSNLNQNINSLEDDIYLSDGENDISVLLKSKPNGRIRIEIIQEIVADGVALVGVEGGNVAVNDSNSPIYGAEADIPYGALLYNEIIKISFEEKKLYIAEYSIPAGESIKYGPEGTTFNKQIILTLPYLDADNDGLVDGTTISESQVKAKYFNPITEEWEGVEIIDRDLDLNRVYIKTDHFSNYITSIDDIRIYHSYDTSEKFLLRGKITGHDENDTYVNLTFFNTSGAWVQLTPNFDEANSISLTEVILVPPDYFLGSKVELGTYRFSPGQHMQFDVGRDIVKQPAVIAVTAIDLIMRGVFSTRFEVSSLDTALLPTLKIISSLGDSGKLVAMGGYLANGQVIKASQEAMKWFFSVEKSQIENAFVNVFHLGTKYNYLVSSTLTNLIQAISLPHKYYLLKELSLGTLNAPFDGYVRVDLKYVDDPPLGTVVSNTGRVWMDRNLGASRVATSPTDTLAYGDLYQWGRGADGHQLRTSNVTSTLSTTDNPSHGYFILTSTSSDDWPYDWRNPPNINLWQGKVGINNPCPAGFRLPTASEWETERASWASNDSAGALASPLKIVAAGYRHRGDGTVSKTGSYGFYWASTVDNSYASYLFFYSDYAQVRPTFRTFGFSVRCIQD
jgi:uncharacterized protein (TIGR02145 family)